MDKGFEQITFDFNAKAIKIFFDLFDKFREATMHLDRQKDENVFQQQLSRYQITLKQQLGQVAKQILDKNKSQVNISLFNKILAEKIDYFLHEFKTKSTSV